MKVTEDFISAVEESGELQEMAPSYPSAFGITLTPVIGSLLFAVVGLGAGLYLLLSQLIPAWENHQKLEADLAQKQTQVQQKQVGLQQSQKIKTEQAQAKQQQKQVLTMFANQKTLDTLLLDLNRLIESANAKLSRNSVGAKLERFVPVNQSAEVIMDGSLGSQVNGKLKRRVFNVAFSGTFEQTESIFRNIERLQPLLTIKDYQSTLAPTPPADAKGKVVRGGPAIIKTSLQLQAIMPVSPEEAAQVTAAANQQKK